MPSATSAHDLPHEIIDMVVDHTKSDTTTLRALRLVSKSWSLRSRNCLFREIVLSTEDRCITFKSLFEERASLSCVKALAIRVSTLHNWLNDRPSESILPILPLLDSLTHFSIFGGCENLSWMEMSPSVKIAFYEVMERPYVTSITLSCITDFDILPLTQYLHLEELILDTLTLSVDTSVEFSACFPLKSPSSPAHRSYLRRLVVTASPRPLMALLTTCSKRSQETGTLDLSNLTHLKVSTPYQADEVESADWASFFDICAASIESYTVYQRTVQVPFPPEIIPLHQFLNLKKFLLTIDYHASTRDGHNSFPTFVEALDRFSRAGNETSMTNIRVEYEGCGRYFEKEIDTLMDGQWLRRFDEVIQRPAFSKLKEVVFGFGPYCCRVAEGWSETFDRIRSQLSSLDRRGILSTLTKSL
ncbi:hypothetical protein H1R20_g9702, partial [Candolleomyces eurysporus]